MAVLSWSAFCTGCTDFSMADPYQKVILLVGLAGHMLLGCLYEKNYH